MALSALLLSRSRLRTGTTAWATVGVTALAFAYGIVNCVRDAWNEQLVKRGTTDSKLPSVIRPDLSAAWLGIVLGACLIYFALFGVGRVNRPEGGIR